VYKEPSITRLAEVTDRMKGLIQKITGTETKVEVVGDSKPLLGGDGGVQVRPRGHTKQLTIGSLDASTVVQLQVVALEPYFEEDEMAMREHSYLKQRHVIKRFMYSSPFTKSGKAYGSTQTQFRRNFVLEVEHPFPYTLVRQRVKSRSTVDLSPIECSIQDIVKRVTHLQSEIDKAEALRKDLLKIDTRSITQILQGSVMMQVHGGVLEVGESFLKTRDMPLELTEAMKLKSKEEIQEWSQNNKTKLRLQLVEFMQMCMRLMQIYGDVLKAMKQEAANDKKAQVDPVADNARDEWYSELEKSFAQMMKRLEPMLKGTAGADKLQTLSFFLLASKDSKV